MAAEIVPVVELIDGLKDDGWKRLWVNALDDHPNAKANNLVSDQLKRWILEDTGND
jgi:hypothetical protein